MASLMRGMIALIIGGFFLAQIALPGARPRAGVDKTMPDAVASSEKDADRATEPSTKPAAYDPDLANVTVLDRAPNGHFFAKAEVNFAQVNFLVDTGATTIALTEEDARRANVKFDPTQYIVVGQGAAGPVYGAPIEIEAITLDGHRERGLTGVVIKGADISLLGQSFLRRYARVEISGDRMMLR